MSQKLRDPSKIPSSSRGFSDLVDAADLDRFQQAWDDLGHLGYSNSDLSDARADLISRLCRERGVSECLSVLSKLLGEGSDRDHYVAIIFGASKQDPHELLLALENLTVTTERRAAADALHWQNLSIKDFSDLGKMSNQCADLFVSVLSSAVGTAENPAEEASYCLHELKRSMDSGRISPGSLTKFLHRMSVESPFVAWELRGELIGSANEVSAAVNHFAENMAKSDPKRALLMFSKSNDTAALVGVAFSQWLNSNRRDSMAWFAENQSNIPPQAASNLLSSIARIDLRQGNFQDAWKWARDIDDPEVRRRTEGEVWSAERNLVRRETSENPSQTIQALISGESKHADYWIEEAMITWISKEPDKAELWYQKNWDSLPPAKSQYVAAAYAKDALAHGDTVTARQWAALVEDAKVRERIEASITKAVAAEGN